MDTITLTSTTDDESQVRSALGLTSVEAPKEPEAITPPAAPDVVAAPAAEAVDTDPDEDEDVPSAQATAGKKRGKLQSRINELVRERNETRALSGAQQAELDALRKKVSELVAAGPAAQVAKLSPSTTEASELPAEPKVEDFTTYEDYTKSVAKWAAKVAKLEDAQSRIDVKSEVERQVKDRLDSDKREREESARRAEHDRLVTAYQAQADTARTKYEDFDEVVGNSEINPTPMLLDQLRHSEVGAEIAYYLGTHLDECNKIITLGNTAAALKAFGKLEAKVEQSLATPTPAVAPTAAGGAGRKTLASVAPPAATTRQVTKAPDPITPVGSTTSATTTMDPNTLPYSEFKVWREESIQRARRHGLK